MGSIATQLCTKLLDHVFENTAYTPSATVYCSLHTGDPGETGASECTYTGYGTRPSIAFGAAATRKVVQTAAAVTFPQCTGTGNDATHYGIWSAATGGDFLAGGSLSSTLNIVNGNTPSIAASEVEISFNAGTTVGITDYLVHKLLDRAFRNQAYAQPTISLALFTTTNADGTPGTECANANNYSRKLAPNWDAAASGATQNTDLLTFATPSGSWGTIVSVGIMDSNTHGAGNMLFYGNDVTDQAVGANDTVQFAAGALDVSMS
jgi:hypothetical protein